MVKVTTARYSRTRFDIPEGREWEVTTPEGHSYLVTIWKDSEHGRMATCRCRAFTFGQVCRHVRYAQRVDSFLTGAPVRDIQGVAA